MNDHARERCEAFHARKRSAAEALITELGLDEIAESFPAYIILPLPQNGKSWTEADLDLYWEAQFFLAGGLVDANTQPPQGEYVRHTMNTLQYVIGEGSGASFIHSANPYWRYTPDQYQVVIDKDLEWRISSFYREDFAAPMVQSVTLIGAGHSNADYMATIAWDFMSRFARAEDGSLLEN